MKIDCHECRMYRSDHCEDCLVTALLQPPTEEVEIDDDFEPPLGALADAGLIPVLKFRPREGAGTEPPQGQADARAG